MFWYLHQDWWHYNTFIKVYISHEFAKVLFFVVKLHYRFLYESIFHRTLLTLPAIVWLLPRCPRCLPWDGPYCVSSLSMCKPEKSHQLKVYSIYNNNPQQNTNIKYYTINSKFRIHNLVEDIKMYAYSLILTYNKHNVGCWSLGVLKMVDGVNWDKYRSRRARPLGWSAGVGQLPANAYDHNNWS